MGTGWDTTSAPTCSGSSGLPVGQGMGHPLSPAALSDTAY